MSEANTTDIRALLSQVAPPKALGRNHAVSFTSRSNERILTNEDRYFAEDWDLANGVWKLAFVLDGHGGTATVDFVLENLPSVLKAALVSGIDSSTLTLDDAAVARIMSEALLSLQDQLTNEFLSLIPTKPDDLAAFDAKATFQDRTGKPGVILRRVMSGTTASVALIDPTNRVHIAGVGDSDAFLCFTSSADETDWDCCSMGFAHRCSDPMEAARILGEHPGEPDCISQTGVPRLLGWHVLSRAMGNIYFNLPIDILRILDVGLGEEKPFNEAFLRLFKTPPYLSHIPQVSHESRPTQKFLILASDGLGHLMQRRLTGADSVVLGRICANAVARAEAAGQNLAEAVLWEAMGGDGPDNLCLSAINGTAKGRVDDTTVVVIPL
ncbi:Serine/threonine protein phosphatase 2C [Mycena indigotica]|uniref:Serine/threonine protein phosphatase 2C n=1 Tax=Mycena indigotica TaxID=2126181 RepID=A0A8H6SNL8_9AGAR|nr:Serine/threonine protein phosphatase 2C [Mycena indigotica]KAF7301120.1 Serine/threonine protein phosphatase 2C [Mycena indigotica]